MPRGFLVKRSRRTPPACYRLRSDGEEEAHTHAHTHAQQTHARRRVSVSTHAHTEPADPAIFAPVDLKRPSVGGGHADRKGRPPPPPRKTKANRKLHFEDDVTTSPVLGLKIKEEAPPKDDRKSPGPGGGGGGGGGGEGWGFVCQLCREAYADPPSLAQHRCARIVRVEYRCPECEKAFSCPANLASHRRWHKPRPPPGGAGSVAEGAGLVPSAVGGAEKPPACGKAAGEKPLNLSASASNSGHVRVHVASARAHADAHAFPCAHCPALLHSSPGLTRHVNKCHPVMLHVPLRPAC
ncbi:insulinoma-associated protein 1a [Menidia menidia]